MSACTEMMALHTDNCT